MAVAVSASPVPILQFFNNAGQPNVGGSVLTQVGGVNTATYQDSGGSIPLPNPIPLNSRGEISNATGLSCQLFLQVGVVYTFTIFDAAGNQIGQATYVNNVPVLTPSVIAPLLTQANVGAALYPQTAAEIMAGVTPANYGYPPLYARRYGVKFDGVTDDAPAWNSAIQVALATASEFGTLYTGGATVIGDIGVTRCASTILLASNVRIRGPNLPTGQGSTFSAAMMPGGMVFFDDITNTTSYLFDTAPFVQTTAVNGDGGTAAAGAASTITLRAAAPNCTGGVITITSGTGSGQVRNIVSQAGVVATVAWPWATVPDATSVYSVQGFAVGSRFTAESSPFSNSTHFVPQIALPYLSSTENCGLENFSMFSLRGHRYGIRLLGADHASIRNIYATGFKNPFQDVGGQINTWDNVTTDVSTGSFQVGFGWIYEDAQHTIRQCSAFGDSGVTQPSAGDRPWFVDMLGLNGSDANPDYQTGHYCYQNVGMHFDNSDGEGVDRAFLDMGPMGTVYTNCHMERFQHVGRYQNGGRASWYGGMIDPGVSGAPAFDGKNCEFTLDSAANSLDFFGQTSYPQLGSFASPFGGRVTVRNMKPVAADSIPTSPIVQWDTYPQQVTLYVSQEFGNDDNSGTGTSSTLASLAEAMARIPEGGSGIIHLSKGETDFTVATTTRVTDLTQRRKKITIIGDLNTGGAPVITFPTVSGAVTPIILEDTDVTLNNVYMKHDSTSAVGATMFLCSGRCGIYCTDVQFTVTAPSTNIKTIALAGAPASGGAGYVPAEITLAMQASSSGAAAVGGDGTTTGHLADVQTGACGTWVSVKNSNTTLGAGITGTYGGLTAISSGI